MLLTAALTAGSIQGPVFAAQLAQDPIIFEDAAQEGGAQEETSTEEVETYVSDTLEISPNLYSEDDPDSSEAEEDPLIREDREEEEQEEDTGMESEIPEDSNAVDYVDSTEEGTEESSQEAKEEPAEEPTEEAVEETAEESDPDQSPAPDFTPEELALYQSRLRIWKYGNAITIAYDSCGDENDPFHAGAAGIAEPLDFSVYSLLTEELLYTGSLQSTAESSMCFTTVDFGMLSEGQDQTTDALSVEGIPVKVILEDGTEANHRLVQTVTQDIASLAIRQVDISEENGTILSWEPVADASGYTFYVEVPGEEYSTVSLYETYETELFLEKINHPDTLVLAAAWKYDNDGVGRIYSETKAFHLVEYSEDNPDKTEETEGLENSDVVEDQDEIITDEKVSDSTDLTDETVTDDLDDATETQDSSLDNESPVPEAGNDNGSEEGIENKDPEEEIVKEGASDAGTADTDKNEILEEDREETVESEALNADLSGTEIAPQVLSEDMTINGDAFINQSGIIDLNGHTLTITGNLLHSNGALVVNGGTLEVTGDYRIQNRNSDGSYSSSSGVLVMKNAEDAVKVGGDFYARGSQAYYNEKGEYVEDVLSAGTLEVSGNFYQAGTYNSFQATGDHKLVLAGTGEKTVSFNYSESCVNILEVEDGVSLSWENYFNVAKLTGDLTVNIVNEDGFELYSEQGKLDLNGHVLTFNGNIARVSGILYLRGNKLKVNGTLLQRDGKIVVDGGTLEVTGDYRIQNRNSDGSYSSSSGVLVMKNAEDAVKVGGDFYARGSQAYYNEKGEYVEDVLSAGTLEVSGNFYQAGTYNSFQATGDHKLVLAGTGEKTVSFNYSESCVNILEVEDGVSLSWENYFNVAKLTGDLTVNIVNEDGFELYSEQGKLDLNGHVLTFNGNIARVSGILYLRGNKLKVNGTLLQRDGKIVVDGGTLEVTGDYRIQNRNSDGSYSSSSGVLVMKNAEDAVKVGGDFYPSGNNYYYDEEDDYITDILSAGVMELKGNFYQPSNSYYGSFAPTGTHRVILTGKGQRFIDFTDEESAFQNLEITQDPKNYIFSRIPCWNKVYRNGTELQASVFGEFTIRIKETSSGKVAVITGYNGSSQVVTIPSSFGGCPVIEIGERAFKNADKVKSVILPISLKTIGYGAFMNCSSLEDIQIPDDVTVIGEYAFSGCSSLQTLTIPTGVTMIDYGVFDDCYALEQLFIPASVIEIHSYFYDSDNLTLYVEPDSYAETFAKENGIPYEYMINTGHKLTAVVKDSSGNVIEDGFSIYWYAENTGKLLGASSVLRNVQKDSSYVCAVILEEDLNYLYIQPEDVTKKAGDQDETIEITLEDIGSLIITGTVKDEEGNIIADASLKLKQLYNGGYEKNLETQSDSTGAFGFDAMKVRTTLVVTAEGYYNGYYTLYNGYSSGSVGSTGNSSDSAFSGTSSEENTAESANGSQEAEGEVSVEAVLRKMPSNRISFSLYRQDAVEEGEASTKTQLSNTNNLTITAYNETAKKKIEKLTVQYPYINLGEGMSSAGDVIRFTMMDTNGIMTAQDARVTLDEARCGSFEWTLVQNGSINISRLSGEEEKTIMLFDRNGKCVETGSTASAFTSAPLPADTYTCVIMQKTSLLRSVNSYSALAEYGLSKGTDYLEESVTVKNGVITVLSDLQVPVFDVTKLYFTNAENTRFVSNMTTAATGQYVTLHALYEIEDKHKCSDEAVRLIIPEGLTFVEGSLTVNGKSSACTIDGDTITVHVGEKKGAVRFYVLPASADSYRLQADLAFTSGSEKIIQPIGAVYLEAAAAKISVPEHTGYKQVTATGKAIANCEITVYDNGTAVGTTTSRKNGSWSLTFDLVNPRKYSYHDIYATVKSTDYGVNIETNVARLLYDNAYVEISKVTMINTSYPHKETRTVFDFLHPSTKTLTYDYYPSYSKFTFIASFTGGDYDTLSNVYVVTVDSSGNNTFVPLEYDDVGKVWIGTHDYKSFSDVPCGVGINYNNLSSSCAELVSPDNFEDLYSDFYSIAKPVLDELANEAETMNETIEEDYYSVDVKITDNLIARYRMESEDFSNFKPDEWEKNDLTVITYEDGTTAYRTTTSDQASYITCTAFPDDEILIKETVSFDETNMGAKTNIFSGSQTNTPLSVRNSTANMTEEEGCSVPASYSAATDIFSFIGDLTGITGIRDTFIDKVELGKYTKHFFTYSTSLEEKLKKFRRMYESCKCIKHDSQKKAADYAAGMINDFELKCLGHFVAALGIEAALDCGRAASLLTLNGAIKNYSGVLAKNIETRRKLFRCYQRSMGFSGLGRPADVAKKVYESKAQADTIIEIGSEVVENNFTPAFINISAKQSSNLQGGFNDFADLVLGAEDANSFEYKVINDFLDDQMSLIQNMKCGCNGCKCYKEPHIGPSVTPKLDPSGYAYEAVPSNRVEGAEAKIYYYDYALDDFGMPEDEKSEILWDAENYGQINPQITNEQGIFAWDVPQGQWVVKLTKDGYENADSYHDSAVNSEGYLPVPPIQTEVNTAMVSKAAPTVTNLQAYPKQVRIDFSQYMQLDTVDTSHVIISNGGKRVSGIIEPLNAEDNYDGTDRFASSFAFVPDGELKDTVSVNISGVKNYCGKEIAGTWQGSNKVTIMPEGLQMSDAEEIKHHGTGEVEIQILPAAAGANKMLTINSYTPSIVSTIGTDGKPTEQQTVQAGANGVAKVTFAGNLPGQGIVTISLDGTDLCEEKQISVVAAEKIIAIDTFEQMISFSSESCNYNGKEITPAVTIPGLTEGTDFTVAYSNNVKVGTATATITGIGKYTGTITKTFVISPAPVSKASVTGLKTKTYNGKAQTQSPVVKVGGRTLKDKTDYTLSYKNNTNAGTATVTIKGRGNYTGSIAKTFKINKAAQKPACKTSLVSVGKTGTFTITGSKGKLTVTTADKKIAAISKIDQSKKKVTVKGVKVGSVKLTIKSASAANFNAGSVTVTLKIVPAATAKITADNQAKGIKLTWAKVAGANGYIVYRNNKKIKTITKGATVTFTDTAANTNGTKYTYKIVAKASTGNSTLSKSLAAYRVAPPAVKTLKNSSSKKMAVTWGKNAKANGYQIQYSTSSKFKSGNKTANITKAGTVSKVIGSLAKGKTYYVRIRTYKTVGKTKYWSSWSAAKKVKIIK